MPHLLLESDKFVFNVPEMGLLPVCQLLVGAPPPGLLGVVLSLELAFQGRHSLAQVFALLQEYLQDLLVVCKDGGVCRHVLLKPFDSSHDLIVSVHGH